MTEKNNLKALVVEDSVVTQRLLSIFLERMGFEVTLIDNGVDALKKVKEARFDIVFLDVIMPVVDGYAVCKILKGSPETKSIPVIMLTSKDGMFDKVRGKMSGADVYLVKPIKHAALLTAVCKYYPVANGALDVTYAQPSTQKLDQAEAPKVEQEKPKSRPQERTQAKSSPVRRVASAGSTNHKVISIADKIRQARINRGK